MRRLRPLCALRQNRDGIAATEFALVAPVFLMFTMGIIDLGNMAYARTVLNGAVQQAARSTTLEGGSTTAANTLIQGIVRQALPNATVTSTRTSYFDFADIGRPERLNDSNGNGTCNAGETYTDENNNGRWDSDVGNDGNGGANDVVVLNVTVSYRSVFAVPFIPSAWAQRSMTTSMVRKNQPFANQASYGSTARTCT